MLQYNYDQSKDVILSHLVVLCAYDMNRDVISMYFHATIKCANIAWMLEIVGNFGADCKWDREKLWPNVRQRQRGRETERELEVYGLHAKIAFVMLSSITKQFSLIFIY